MTEKTKRALGSGLEALIHQKKDASGKPLMVDIARISLNPDQPRKYFNAGEMEKLVESIKMKGVIEPLVVNTAKGGYQLIAGQRRLMAAKLAGLDQVPVTINEMEDSVKERLEMALAENMLRDDLNPI